ncbi:unnamed protein product, partial [Prorocentrum cordatum]
AMESDWSAAQVGRLANDGLVSLGDILPLRQPWSQEWLQARWGPTTWRFHRAWCTARVALCIPSAVADIVSVEPCPLCGGFTTTLAHLVEACAPVLGWALAPDGDLDVLAARVRLVGAAARAYVSARVR